MEIQKGEFLLVCYIFCYLFISLLKMCSIDDLGLWLKVSERKRR